MKKIIQARGMLSTIIFCTGLIVLSGCSEANKAVAPSGQSCQDLRQLASYSSEQSTYFLNRDMKTEYEKHHNIWLSTIKKIQRNCNGILPDRYMSLTHQIVVPDNL